MSPVTRQHTVFFYQVIALLSVIVLVAGMGGLSLVWLRQQVADTARRTQELQREQTAIVRRLEYLDVKIAEVQRPSFLVRRAGEMGLVLQRPQTGQLVAMGPLPGVTAPLPESAIEAQPAERDPYKNSFDLAVMEPLRGLGK